MVVFHDALVDNIDQIRARLKTEADKFIYMASGSPRGNGSELPGCPDATFGRKIRSTSYPASLSTPHARIPQEASNVLR